MSATVLRMLDPAAYAPNLYALPLALTCALLFAMGALVFTERRGTVPTSFALLVGSAFIWLSGHVFLNLTTDPVAALGWSRYKYLGVTTLGANFYLFTLAYVGRLRAARWSLVASYVLSAGFLALAWLPVDSPFALLRGVRRFAWGYYAQLAPPLGVAYLGMFVVQSSAAFHQVVLARARSRDAAERKRHRLLLASFAAGYLASIDFLPCFGMAVYPAGYLFITLFLAVTAYSIARYNLLDLVTVIHRTGVWALTSLLALVPVTALLVSLEPWLRQQSPIAFTAFHLVLLGLVFVYAKHVQPRIDQIFQRRRYDILRFVAEFNENIRDLHELEPLARRIVDTVERLFRPNHAELLLVTRGAAGPSPPARHSAALVRTADPEACPAFLRWLEQRNEVVDRERFPSPGVPVPAEQEGHGYLRGFDAQLVVPLRERGGLLGMLHIGPRSDGRPYTMWDLQLLSRLQPAAAIALANSLLYEQVQQLNRRLTDINAHLEQSNRSLHARNEELGRTRHQLIQSTKLAAVGEISAKLAHELGNPIGIISSSAQFCLESLSPPPELRKHLQVVGRHAQNAARIVRGLLHLARPSDTAAEPVMLWEVVEQVRMLLGGRCTKRGIRLDAKIPVDLPTVCAARGHLEQVLLNVFLNALDSVPDGGWIAVDARYDADTQAVTLVFRDSGPGVRAEHLDRIFEPFFSTRPGGTGLGLSICRDILGLYGGTIHAAAVPDGTEFVIRMPAAGARDATARMAPDAIAAGFDHRPRA